MEILRQAQDDIAFKGVSKNNDDVMVSGMNEVNVVEAISRKLLVSGSEILPRIAITPLLPAVADYKIPSMLVECHVLAHRISEDSTRAS